MLKPAVLFFVSGLAAGFALAHAGEDPHPLLVQSHVGRDWDFHNAQELEVAPANCPSPQPMFLNSVCEFDERNNPHSNTEVHDT